MNNNMDRLPKPIGMETIDEIQAKAAKERKSITHGTDEEGTETTAEIRQIHELGGAHEVLEKKAQAEEEEWKKAVLAAKSASGDINAMIEEAGPVNDGGEALDPDDFSDLNEKAA